VIFFSAPVLPALLYLNLCLINNHSSYLIRTDGFLVLLRCVLTFICCSLLFIWKLYSFLLWFQLQDTETTTGESEVKFQVSRDTLGAMLRSMAYIREQLSNSVSNLFLLLVAFFHFHYIGASIPLLSFAAKLPKLSSSYTIDIASSMLCSIFKKFRVSI
jgi:hypothetical protein